METDVSAPEIFFLNIQSLNRKRVVHYVNLLYSQIETSDLIGQLAVRSKPYWTAKKAYWTEKSTA